MVFLIKLTGASGRKFPVEGFHDFTRNNYVSFIVLKEHPPVMRISGNKFTDCADDEAAFGVEAVWHLTICIPLISICYVGNSWRQENQNSGSHLC